MGNSQLAFPHNSFSCVVDILGNPVAFLLSVGTNADSTYAIELLSQLPIEHRNILGDKAYDAQKIRMYITEAETSIQYLQK